MNKQFKEYRTLLLKETEMFHQYIIDNSTLIFNNQIAIHKIVSEEKKDPELEPYIHDLYGEDIAKHFRSFPAYFYNSNLVAIYSFLEYNLKSICIEIQKTWKYKLKFSDLKGESIGLSYKYFKLVVDLDLADLETKWQQLKDFQEIRNIIVHNNANIWYDKETPLNKQKHFQLINKMKEFIDLDLNSGDFYIKNSKYLVILLTLSHSYLIAIIDKIEKREIITGEFDENGIRTDIPF